MIELRMTLERIEDGHVEIAVYDLDPLNGQDVRLWSCTVNQESTRQAQREALKATFRYLNQHLHLSEGGSH